MAIIQVAVINQYPPLAAADIQACVDALNAQLKDHFYPAWGIAASVTFYPNPADAPADSWQIVLLDNSDQANALGYHAYTDQGLPQSKVFAGDDIRGGYKWSITASHELLEMLVNPYDGIATVRQMTDGSAQAYRYEICDPCHLDGYGYDIGAVTVSDFVFPSWFRDIPDAKFDQRDLINASFQTLAGCTIERNILNPFTWQDYTQSA